MPQPIRAFVDSSGQAWLVLDNGHRIALPSGGGGSGGGGNGGDGDGGVTDHGELSGLEDDDHPQYLTADRGDARYVNIAGDRMDGLLEVPDLTISGADPEPGMVWTAEDTLGGGSWQEPSALVVAETSDPVLINWFDAAAEGWKQYSGAGTMAWVELDSPSMPGALDCTGDVWAEWQASSPMVFEPGALYRVTVRARLTEAASLSFGFQGYDAATPATVVDAANAASATNPHWCAVGLTAGDSSYVDDTKPGEWLAWTGYLSGRAAGAAEGIPSAGQVAPADAAVRMAAGVSQWRPAFRATGGQVWVDAIEVHRLDRSLELPGGIKASDVYAESVDATTVTTEHLIIPPSTLGYVLTAVDEAGNSEWQYPPITVSEGPPVEEPENPLTVNLGTVAGRQGCMVSGMYPTTTTITATNNWTRVPGSKAVQFTLTQPAMVTARFSSMMRQNANTATFLYTGIAVDDDLGNPYYPDNWDVPGSGGSALCYLKSTTGGDVYISGTSLWKRYLQPGTYIVYPRAYISSADAASARSVSNGCLDLEIDPGMTYLTGQPHS